jgi:hypothetical protein
MEEKDFVRNIVHNVTTKALVFALFRERAKLYITIIE